MRGNRPEGDWGGSRERVVCVDGLLLEPSTLVQYGVREYFAPDKYLPPQIF